MPGGAGPSSPLARAMTSTTVLMDGRSAQVTFAGLAPGFAGLYQINFVVPAGVGGDVVTTVQVGNTVSNEVTINVAGAYSVAANYSGILEFTDTGEQSRLEFNSFTFSSQGSFQGLFRLLSSGVLVDSGSARVDSTEDIFIITVTTASGASFPGIMDTLDAGHSFFGLLFADSDAYNRGDWFASFEVTAAPPPPPPPPPTVLPGISTSCALLEGALIYADDGTFLGEITFNTYAADSIGNPYGRYGSEYSSTSIFNRYGRYGSEYSTTSAFNEFASRPPIIFLNGRAVAYLTVNQFRTPRVDPRALYPCIGRR